MFHTIQKMQFDNGLGSMFALGLLSSMFSGGGFGSPSPSIDYLKKTLDEKDFETTEDENKAE